MDADLQPSEQRVLRTFNSWPKAMRRKVQAWLDTLPNHGSKLDLPPKQMRKAQRWWRAFMNSKSA